MIIEIKSKQFEVLNEELNIQALFDKINDILKKSQLQFEYLIIDDIPVRENFDHYIRRHQKGIERIIVVCQSHKDLVEETLVEAYNYLQNGIPLIHQLADKFYQDPLDKDWLVLADLFEGIQWLNETIEKIETFKDLTKILIDYQKWNEYVTTMKSMVPILLQLQEALENKDIILIADLLLYEMIPGLENAVSQLRFLIPNLGANHVS